jgi:AcrR family transcriptional regulator
LPNIALPRQRRWTGLSAADRQQERRTLLLDAAFELFGSAGFEAMTVRAVLELSRLNPRYFYESFDGVDQLAAAVYDRVAAELGEVVWTALAAVGAAPVDQVRAVVRGIVEFVDEDRRRGRILYVEGLGNEALNRRRLETGRSVLAFVLDSAGDRARAVDEVGRVGASLLVGGFNQLLVDWLAGRVGGSSDQLIEDATALLAALGAAVEGLAATPARRRRSGPATRSR